MDIHAVKHVGRLKDVVFILLKYGFDDVVQRLDLPGKVLIKKAIHIEENLSTAERVRRVLADLGPTFIKFGQLMSLRPDLLPAELVFELEKLHDRVNPLPYQQIQPEIECHLGRPVDEVFINFEETPIASASLAQVHRALLREGRQAVAVKVQRPNIRNDIKSDIAIMEVIAHQLNRRMENLAVYDLPNLVEEFKKTIERELDYRREVTNMRIFQENFANDPAVSVPEVYGDLSTDKLLVMEYVEGKKLNEVPENAQALRQELARRGLQVSVKQILEDGFFHADPHPGNIILRMDKSMCLLDCGMVGRLTDSMRFQLIDMIRAIVDKDSDELVNVLLELTKRYDYQLRDSLQRDVLELLDDYHSLPLEQFAIGRFLAGISDLLRDHQLRLPSNLAIVIKALITTEGVGRQLDPHLNVVAEIEPTVKKLIMEQWKPSVLRKSIRNSLRQLWMMQQHLPRRLTQIMEKLDRGEVRIRFRHENLERLNHTLDVIGSRMTVAIILGSMVIGSSLIITTGVGPLLFGFPALGVIGYLISAVLGMWVVVNILRSN